METQIKYPRYLDTASEAQKQISQLLKDKEQN